MYLKHLFPSLFKNNDSFQCENFQLAKHKRVSYPCHLYCALKPFVLIIAIFGIPLVFGVLFINISLLYLLMTILGCVWGLSFEDKLEAEQVFKNLNFHILVKT